MLSYGPLDRISNPFLKSIVKPCIFKNQEKILAKWV